MELVEILTEHVSLWSNAKLNYWRSAILWIIHFDVISRGNDQQGSDKPFSHYNSVHINRQVTYYNSNRYAFRQSDQ